METKGGKKEKRARGEGRIYVRSDSSFWWIQFYSATGKQIREATKFKHGGNTSTQDNPNRAKAGRVLTKRLGQVAADLFQDTTNLCYEDIRASYYQDYVMQRRRSLRRDKQGNPHMDKVARLDLFFEGRRARDIDAALLREFILNEQKRGLSDSSINRSLKALHRMMNLARKENKLTHIPGFTFLKEPHARQGFFEEHEYRRLLAELPDYLRLPLALGYCTAMRAGEVFAVTWDQVNELEEKIRLRADQTKTGEPREIPIVPELKVHLDAQYVRKQKDRPFVCFRLDPKGHAVKIEGFRKAWDSACVRAGLGRMEPVLDEKGKPLFEKPRGPRSKKKVKMRYVGMLFHDLRRTGVRNLVRAGVPRSVAMEISGHATESVFERYNITSGEDLRDAGEKLAAYHRAQKARADGAVSGPFAVPAPTAKPLVQ